jgi:hypothetical protein
MATMPTHSGSTMMMILRASQTTIMILTRSWIMSKERRGMLRKMRGMLRKMRGMLLVTVVH